MTEVVISRIIRINQALYIGLKSVVAREVGWKRGDLVTLRVEGPRVIACRVRLEEIPEVEKLRYQKEGRRQTVGSQGEGKKHEIER